MGTKSFAIAAATAMMIMGCAQKETAGDSAYIGPSGIKAENGIMTPEILLSFGRLSDPQLSPDGKWILYGVSYTSIEDNRSCRNLFVQEVTKDNSGLAFGDKIQLTKEGKSLSNARWSKDGGSVYYLQGGQLRKAPFSVAGGKPSLGESRQLSDVAEGIGEFALSPDESQVLYVSTIPGPVKTPKDFDEGLDKAKAYVTEDLMYRHWDHWVTERPQTYVAPLSEDTTITEADSMNILGDDAGKYELPIEPFGGLDQAAWSPDGKMVAYSCKKVETGREYAFSTDTDIYIYNIATGETVRVTSGGGYDTDPAWSPDGKKLAFISMARNGYEADKARLFVADMDNGNVRDGKASAKVTGVRELTIGFKYNAAGPVWSEDSKYIYFNALTEGIQAIYKVDALAGGPAREAHTDIAAKPARITPDDAWYDFGSPFAIVDGTLLASYASMEFPTELVAVKEEDGSFGRITDENGHILGQLESGDIQERWITTVDGKKMLTWVLYPPKFDSTKVYPAIEIFLGGPQGTLSQGWSYRWNYRLMASQGYIVILPNRRGTTAFGQEWCEQISGDYIGLNMQDYLSAAREMKKEPYVGKIAACGASYGGFSVYYMAGIHGDTYDCFIAHAGIFDEKYMYYETEEMWFPNWDNGGLTEYSYTPGEMGPRGDGKT
ncbi:MAG: S9 family peptidase, partial [Bacteroidales bacterium]|nr:S9 family peptidase [Bacteroidales bacterium]